MPSYLECAILRWRTPAPAGMVADDERTSAGRAAVEVVPARRYEHGARLLESLGRRWAVGSGREKNGLERRAPEGTELGRTRPAGRHGGLAEANSLGHRVQQGSGPTDGRRVIRGGSWNNEPRRVRSANRNRNDTGNRNDNLGFRLAQSTRASPEPVRPRMRRARRAGVHEPASRPRREGSDE